MAGRRALLQELPLSYYPNQVQSLYPSGIINLKQATSPFKWRHFEPTIILLCVRWYCRFQLSYRDLEEMMGERGLGRGLVTLGIEKWHTI